MTEAAYPRERRTGKSRAFGAFEWLLAMRYLRSRRREGIVSVIAIISFLGIMLGVATLIIVMSVMNGFRTELLSRILGINGHMYVQGIGVNITGYDALAAELRQVPGVTAVAPLVDGQVMVQSPYNAGGALVRGMREADLKSMPLLADNIKQGSLDGLDELGGVAVGSRMAQNLGLNLGDNITLLSPRGAITPFGTAPKVGAFEIRAIFELGMSEYDASFVFMPLDEARMFFRTNEGVTALEIRVTNPDRINDFVARVATAAGPCCQVSTWQQRHESFFSALQVERNVMFLILTLILIVASLNIISGLVMLVKDKGRDIAVLRTMGATRGAVMRAFFISGASIGVMGTIAGFLLGLVFCLNIETLRQWLSSLSGTELFSPEVYFLSRMPAEVDPGEVTAVVLMALFLSFAATLYPAWRAASLDPVEALRYE
jgi:lipoprotein-releasing system permease protein